VKEAGGAADSGDGEQPEAVLGAAAATGWCLGVGCV
jgi:hypothetical protein